MRAKSASIAILTAEVVPTVSMMEGDREGRCSNVLGTKWRNCLWEEGVRLNSSTGPSFQMHGIKALKGERARHQGHVML